MWKKCMNNLVTGYRIYEINDLILKLKATSTRTEIFSHLNWST